LAIGQQGHPHAKSLVAVAKRRHGGKLAGYTVPPREKDLCDLIAGRISKVMGHFPVKSSDGVSIRTLRDAFDEHVIASHLQTVWNVRLPMGSVLRQLHNLSEQSYENKAFTFGCIIDPDLSATTDATGSFPEEFLRAKRYKALSDGFRTAYVVSGNGEVANLVDLEQYQDEELTEKHFFPSWSERMARASRYDKLGIALSRQGDILIFEEGTLRFSYRFGRWQHWNHRFLLNLLRNQARAQGVKPSQLGRVIGPIYRAALDISFRRSGGLFVILKNRNNLRKLVRSGDGIGDERRLSADADFDDIFDGQTIKTLHRAIAVELASLDGAIVIDNTGKIRAYGAVLKPGNKAAKKGQRVEGSRTQAAIAASHFGLAIKISSDGDITVFTNGNEYISV
jgi:DNA integrity scanning protein DisA with diadenylate cyclase activity